MRISESGAQEYTLASVPLGETVEVIEIRAEDPQRLLVHGVRVGARLVVETDAPFGGPRVVRIGRSRIAVDRRLARTVRVERADPA
jgi:Fe2+ transport system protein FeoA